MAAPRDPQETRVSRARRDRAAVFARQTWESSEDGPPAACVITGGELSALEHILRAFALALHDAHELSWDEPLQILSEEITQTLLGRIAAAEQRPRGTGPEPSEGGHP